MDQICQGQAHYVVESSSSTSSSSFCCFRSELSDLARAWTQMVYGALLGPLVGYDLAGVLAYYNATYSRVIKDCLGDFVTS